MTRDELAAIGLATFGVEWQSALARAIGISPRHMRRLIKGERPIRPDTEQAIRKLLGGADIPDPDWPRDRWIIGDAAREEDTGARREYVMHTKRPRFVARIVAVDDEGLPERSEEPADILTGITYASSDCVISEIVWIDSPPSGPGEIHRLLEEAGDAIDAGTE